MVSGNVGNVNATPGGGGGGGGVAVITLVESTDKDGASQNHSSSGRQEGQEAEAAAGGGGGRRRDSSAMAATSGAEGKLTVGRLSVASLVADFCIIFAIGVPILLVVLMAEPLHRGFFCDDESIRLPVKEDTISTAVLILIGVAIPLIVVVCCECVWVRRVGGPAARARRVAVARVTVAAWVVRVAWTVTLFVFGLVAEETIVEAAKFTIGRLRPHFLDVCRPSPPLSVLCGGGGGNASTTTSSFLARGSIFGGAVAFPDPHLYVRDFTCTGDPKTVRQARLSFPSGHSSMSFYSAIFTALYLQRRFRWRSRARLQLVFGQLVLVLLAWLTALTRVSDHKHHWSDVLAGGAIGSAAAVLTVIIITPDRKKSIESPEANSTYTFGEPSPHATIIVDTLPDST